MPPNATTTAPQLTPEQMLEAINYRESRRAKADYKGLMADLESVIAQPDHLGFTAQAFQQSPTATKSVMERYVQNLAECFTFIAKSGALPAQRQSLLARARAACPRTALMLSGGGLLGNYHLGVLSRLLDENLLPAIISGSSAGAYIAGIAGTRSDADLQELIDSNRLALTARLEHNPFRWLVFGAHRPIDGPRLKQLIADIVPDVTFREAHQISGRCLNISVTAASPVHARILNFLVTPNVLVRGAILASCAVPGGLEPVILHERTATETRVYEPGTEWVDGSLTADLPREQLEEFYGIKCAAASIVNPVVLPFVRDPHNNPGIAERAFSSSALFTKFCVHSTVKFMEPATRQIPQLNFLFNAFAAVTAQKYTADINIIPRQRLHDPRRILGEAELHELRDFIAEGAHATDGRMQNLKVCLQLDCTLDKLLGPPAAAQFA